MDKQQLAREYAAQINWDIADHCFDADFGFASHVTYSDKIKYRANEVLSAMKIELGLLDHNFTIWQRMNYYLTGECVAFLPK